MKKIVSIILIFTACSIIAFSITSCSEDEGLSDKEKLMLMQNHERVLFEIPKGVAQ